MRNLARLHSPLILIVGSKSYNNTFRVSGGSYHRRTGLKETEEAIKAAFDQMVDSSYLTVRDLSRPHTCERIYSLAPKGAAAYKKLCEDRDRLVHQ